VFLYALHVLTIIRDYFSKEYPIRLRNGDPVCFTTEEIYFLNVQNNFRLQGFNVAKCMTSIKSDDSLAYGGRNVSLDMQANMMAIYGEEPTGSRCLLLHEEACLKKTDYTKPSFASSIITGIKRGGKECNPVTLHGRGHQ
jgi:hypothetical protein